jgi:regulator of replication initiation timing
VHADEPPLADEQEMRRRYSRHACASALCGSNTLWIVSATGERAASIARPQSVEISRRRHEKVTDVSDISAHKAANTKADSMSGYDVKFESRRRWTGRALGLGLLLGAVTITAPAVGDQIADLAHRLARLRGEVEQLSAELARKDNQLRDHLRSLARQKADLKLELQKEQVRLQKTQLAISQKKKLIATEQAEDEAVKPLYRAAIEDVRGYVAQSLPFRKSERLAELDKIDDQLKTGLLTPPRALSRLWTFIEDEFRLTRESGMYRQPIQLDGAEVLADVVRVGMVMLFFKTNDGVVGYAARAGNGWEYRSITSTEDSRLVNDFFESHKKQIRVGFFELPNALPQMEAK